MRSAASIGVLLSLATHPASGRRVAAPGDRVALELALGLGSPVRGIHLGGGDAPALAEYLHMGLGSIEVIAVPDQADPLPALVAHLKQGAIDLLLCGQRAGSGRGSGMLPYALAQALARPIVAGVRTIGAVQEGWIAGVNLGFGRERRFGLPSACVMIADPKAAVPRYGSFAAMRRGTVTLRPAAPGDAGEPVPAIPYIPAGRRAAPIRPVIGDTPAERLDVISALPGHAGKTALRMTPDEAADAILEALAERQLGPFSSAQEGTAS